MLLHKRLCLQPSSIVDRCSHTLQHQVQRYNQSYHRLKRDESNTSSVLKVWVWVIGAFMSFCIYCVLLSQIMGLHTSKRCVGFTEFKNVGVTEERLRHANSIPRYWWQSSLAEHTCGKFQTVEYRFVSSMSVKSRVLSNVLISHDFVVSFTNSFRMLPWDIVYGDNNLLHSPA